jgi:hypothetical protein
MRRYGRWSETTSSVGSEKNSNRVTRGNQILRYNFSMKLRTRHYLVPEDRKAASRLVYKRHENDQPRNSSSESDEWAAWVNAQIRDVVFAAVEIIAETNAKREREFRAKFARLTAELTILRLDFRTLLGKSALLDALAKKGRSRP